MGVRDVWGVLSWFRGVELLLRQLEIPGKGKAKRTWPQGSAGLIFLGSSNLRHSLRLFVRLRELLIFYIAFRPRGICHFHDHNVNPVTIGGSLRHFFALFPALQSKAFRAAIPWRVRKQRAYRETTFIKWRQLSAGLRYATGPALVPDDFAKSPAVALHAYTNYNNKWKN